MEQKRKRMLLETKQVATHQRKPLNQNLERTSVIKPRTNGSLHEQVVNYSRPEFERKRSKSEMIDNGTASRSDVCHQRTLQNPASISSDKRTVYPQKTFFSAYDKVYRLVQ